MRLIRAVLSVAFRQSMTTMKPAGRGGPLMLFHIETGGCGGCGMELRALASAPYDLGGAGFGLAGTPAGADMLLVSGPLTRMMAPVLQAAWEAMPDPKGIICLGDCALDGGVFGENYATLGGLERHVTIDLRLPGCPPTPADVLAGLASLLGGGVQESMPRSDTGGSL
ncbi:NADH-quinone oxidoreductase subunit B [Acetobacter suratthaniensis]|uniref:NADH-quinone oxidoreductase subunit B n=1 Tax=Acetobacter suratthaniensis TaxID=1502841 RepID=A0ABS3LJ61_9PROT|nr:NADH-quinone oxidoreductase subunit B [Acetobacter suratthaniensis]MBO1327087.1 NADH-quinone oxidoreductase subunit B [Acetobacter suratthaniensis]MCX2565302.1 NADH-quinone oxidoreductase subunit B [Acetobacter suratthaniensis]